MDKFSQLYNEVFEILLEYQQLLNQDDCPDWVEGELRLLATLFSNALIASLHPEKVCLKCKEQLCFIRSIEEDTPGNPEGVTTPQRYLREGWECPKCFYFFDPHSNE